MMLNKNFLNNIYEWRAAAETEGAAALIDKQSGWTSFDVVAKLRSLFKIKKVGHAGTLDPLATGLVILCFGKATKTITSYQDLRKKYNAVMKLGATTATDDSEGEEENIMSLEGISGEAIKETGTGFIGKIMQVPPDFSAKKVNGQPLYKKARKKIAVEPAPCPVEVYDLKINKIRLPFVEFEVECSKGTYIRSLARDIGKVLGCGAYLTSLRRTAIGNFKVDDAVTIEEIKEYYIQNI